MLQSKRKGLEFIGKRDSVRLRIGALLGTNNDSFGLQNNHSPCFFREAEAVVHFLMRESGILTLNAAGRFGRPVRATRSLGRRMAGRPRGLLSAKTESW